MNRTFGEDLVWSWGFVVNFAALFVAVAPVFKRLLKGLPGIISAPVLCCALALCWLILCARFFEKRAARQGELSLRFIAFVHFAPTIAVSVLIGYFVLRMAWFS